VSQRLVPKAGGAGRVAAIEVMLNTPRVADLIAKGEIGALKSVIEDNVLDGSQSFDQALFELYKKSEITLDEALKQADSANNLRLRIKMSGTTPAGDKPTFTVQKKEEDQDWAA
jgi:twitching motility protein PilU